ncbi:hypothetical protein [Pontibacillus yanchengensis]|nr:hypothetical protein [Pontibacillus yanchengensis]
MLSEQGRGSGDFDSYGDINRAEMAKVLDEFLSFVEIINDSNENN